MKVIVDIPDTQRGEDFLKRIKSLSYVQTAKKVTASQEELLRELNEIKKAHRLADGVKNGRIKTRSIDALLNG
jgi:hypothetical protein